MTPEILKQIPIETLVALQKSISKEIRFRKKANTPSYPILHGTKNHEHNGSGLFALRAVHQSFVKRLRYLPPLIDQDWSHIYPDKPCDSEYYVYVHLDPGSKSYSWSKDYGGVFEGTPFYVGKGSGRRAYDLKRNQGHGLKIKKVLSKGWKPADIVHIAFRGLSEQKAFEVESKLIYFFGGIYERGERSGVLYNLDIPKIPDFDGLMSKPRTTFKKLKDTKVI